tara:strand:- start:319 stop:501 length:183 start_codon:yes stop_codon:yes gene_type:complete
MEFKTICKKCRGEDVRVQAWVNPNTDDVDEYSVGDKSKHQEDTWCDDCDEYADLIDVEVK